MEKEYQVLSAEERQRCGWRVMKRNPKVYVRGPVCHPDQAAIKLDAWHEVLMNTEYLSDAVRDVEVPDRS